MGLRDSVVKLLVKETKLPKKQVYSLLEIPPDPKLGDLAFPCFILSKRLKKSPGEVAKNLREKLAVPKGLSKIEVAGPYLNFYFSPSEFTKETLTEASKVGFGSGKKIDTIMVEYSGPNPLKGFHVGHLRNTALGSALCKILAFSGYKVIPVNYYNDTGSHIAKTLWAYDKWYKSKESSIKIRCSWLGEIYTRVSNEISKKDSYEKQVLESHRIIKSGVK